nr:SGNH/GDSL hydrolase family protein [uncultured Draconibacterium sp.]
MKKVIILLICLISSHFMGYAQEALGKEKNAQVNRMRNLTPEQIEEFKNKMNEMFRNDFANLKKYSAENETLGAPAEGENRVVFMGNSITEWWGPYWNTHFSGKPYINRGIAGQTTAQMLIRFKPDVVNLKPKVVVILAGINDITGMTGPTTNKMIEDNLSSMVEIAHANNIKVVLSSVLPCSSIVGRPDLQPADRVVDLNKWINVYAKKKGCVFINYFTPMADENNGLKNEYTKDGVHPNEKGYDVMGPLVNEAIRKVLKE